MNVPQFPPPKSSPRIRVFHGAPAFYLILCSACRLIALALSAVPWLASADSTIKSRVADDDARSVTETISDSRGKLQKKTVLYFATSDWENKSNWSTGAVHYNPDNTIRYKETYQRDANGVMLQTWLYSKDDKILGHRVFHYDAKGKIERVDDFDANGNVLVPAPPKAAPASKGRPDKKKR
jgi:hypothetical protein